MGVKKEAAGLGIALSICAALTWSAWLDRNWVRVGQFVILALIMIVAFLHSIIQARRAQHPGAGGHAGREEAGQDDARSEPRPPTARW